MNEYQAELQTVVQYRHLNPVHGGATGESEILE